ncbi:MAG: antibiotic biosynthesis monooxygenase [Solirubrobacteraceae bacterium]
MYASIRRYQLTAGSMDDLLHLVDTDFAETISEADGFVAYEVLDGGDGKLTTISFFRDADAAEASDDLAREWVASTLAPQFDLTRIDAMLGEVAVSRAASEMLQPAHH